MSAPNTAQGILACLTLLTIATARADAIADCLTIKADPQRLACYDNAAKAAAEARAKSGQVRATSEAERVLKAPDASILSPEQSAAAKVAVEQMNKLTAATALGISYRDYGTRIVDISAEFKESTRSLPESDLSKQLSMALGDHVKAREIWNALIEARYGEAFEKVYCPSLSAETRR